MHVLKSYSLRLMHMFRANTLHNINNLGLCIRVCVYNTLSMRLDMSHGMRKSVFGV